MQVVFRVDASNRIGTGHTTRCLTLADCLATKGAECRFVHRLHTGHMADAIRNRGYPVAELPSPVSSEPAADADYENWLGVSQAQDAEQTIKALDGTTAAWFVVDHYSLDFSWEEAIRPYTKHVAVIDDLANRRHDCDLLVDQNYFPDAEARYDGLLPEQARHLCGPRYSLLRSEYAQARRFIGPRRGPLSRVLVYYGGTDPSNETARALRVLSRPEFNHLAVDVVIGVNNPNRATLIEQAKKRPLTDVYGQREHLVDLMIEADLAIGAGGSTTWERCTLGLPSIVTTVAHNQAPYNAAMAVDGMIHYLGHSADITDDDVAIILRRSLTIPQVIQEQAHRVWQVTDGKGTSRVAEIISPSQTDTFTLQATHNDRVMSHSRRPGHAPSGDDSLEHEPIVTDEPSVLDPSVSDSETKIWFLTSPGGLHIGQVRLNIHGDDASLDYKIESDFQEREWAPHIINLITAYWRYAYINDALDDGLYYASTAIKETFLSAKRIETSIRDSATTRYSLTILSDHKTWLNDWIPALLVDWLSSGHRVRWIHRANELQTGDFCFLLGCSQRVRSELLERHRNNLVVHESKLPQGRGWSPLTWQVLEGADSIPVTLFEATEAMDAGNIYLEDCFDLQGHELIGELRRKQAHSTLSLCRTFVANYPQVLKLARAQVGPASWYPRRTADDSKLDPTTSLADQFNVLRVADNKHYPAFFDHANHRYLLKICKSN